MMFQLFAGSPVADPTTPSQSKSQLRARRGSVIVIGTPVEPTIVALVQDATVPVVPHVQSAVIVARIGVETPLSVSTQFVPLQTALKRSVVAGITEIGRA